MVWVNLLPWRTRQLHVRLRRCVLTLLALSGSLPVAMLSVIGQQTVNAQLQSVLQRQRESIQQINALKIRVDTRVHQRKGLEQRLSVHHQTQKQLILWRDFSRQLAGHLPETLWLSEVTKTPEQLTIAGFCLVISDVQLFRQRLQQLPLFRQVTTGSLSRSRNGTIKFSLQAVLSNTDDLIEVSSARPALQGAAQ